VWVCRFGVVWAGCTVAPATAYIGSRNAGRARTVCPGRKEGERKVQGRWEEGQLLQLGEAVTSSPDVIDAGRSVNSTFSVANLLAGAGAGAEYLRIRGRSAGSSQSDSHAYSKIELFFCRRGGVRSLDEPI
jgi:hypothetical protein